MDSRSPLRSLLLFLPIALLLYAAACSPAPAPPPPETPVEESPTVQAAATALRPSSTPTPTSPPPSITPTPTPTPEDPASETAQPEEAVEDRPTAEAQPEAQPKPTETEVAAAETPTEEAGPAPAETAEPCQEKVAFYGDVTIPDDTLFDQGTAFVKTWRVRNEGTCAWGPDYDLVFIGGNSMSGPLSTPLVVANPGDIVELSVSLVAPWEGGTFTANYLFRSPSGQLFGVGITGKGQLYTRIATKWLPPEGSQPAEVAEIGPETVPAANRPNIEPEGIPSTAITGCQVERKGRFENEILDLFNRLRASLKLPPLTLEYRLSAAAFLHSQDMACRDHTNHVGSDGSTWDSRVAAQGYAAAYVLENIYAANPEFGGDAQYVYNRWFESAIHYRNITDPRVTEVGIGYVYSPNSRFKGYTTAVFARPEGEE